MIRVGVLGYGYWGPNIVRNFHAHEQSEVVLVCDKNSKAGERLRKAYPGISFTTDENEILSSPKVDAACVITPVATHYSLAKRALQNGKHVFVEKPFTWKIKPLSTTVPMACESCAFSKRRTNRFATGVWR